MREPTLPPPPADPAPALALVPGSPTAGPRTQAVWTTGRVLIAAGALGYLALLLFLPLGALVWRAASLGISALADALTSTEALGALGTSLFVAAVVLVINTGFGIAGAVVLVRHDFFGRRVIDTLVDLPLAISPVMTGLGLLLAFGEDGLFAPALEFLGWKVTFALPGVVLATLFVTLPLTLRQMGHVLAQLGTSEEDAAATLGASRWVTFWRVTFPNLRHGLVFGTTLTTARSLSEFGAVLVVGGAIRGRTETATTLIYSALEERKEATAYGMALLLALLSALLLLALSWLKSRPRDA